MSKTQLLERPAQLRNPEASPVRKNTDFIGLIMLIVLGAFLTAVFLKLIDYEMTHSFKWLNHTVQVDPSWY